jgi:hypothetical protein
MDTATDMGAVDHRARFFYDGGPAACTTPPSLDIVGCPVRQEDDDANGTRVQLATFTYGAAGALVAARYERDVGTISIRFHYGKDGALVSADIDQRDDGTIDATMRYHTEGDTVINDHANATGNLLRRSRYTYEGKNLVLIEMDEHADGTIDRTTRNTYAQGRIASTEISDEKGEVFATSTFSYDCKLGTASSDSPSRDSSSVTAAQRPDSQVPHADDRRVDGQGSDADRTTSTSALTNTGFDLWVAPTGATKWWLDGEARTDRFPVRIRRLRPGSHTLRIEGPPGFASDERSITVKAGESPPIHIELRPL